MPKNALIDLLHLQNPWWNNPDYQPREDRLMHRQLFDELARNAQGVRQIIGLIGLRRTGKSTLLRQIIARLLEKLPPKYILYFAFDEPAVAENPETLTSIIQFYLQEILRTNIHSQDKVCYLFFDEIQLVPYWQDILKRYYDLSPYFKFIVSGSSSLFLRKGSRESLAGRMFEKKLPPLSFREYRSLNPEGSFTDYLAFGGFPELLQFPESVQRIEYLKTWIIGKILEIDIPKLAGIRHGVEFERLFWSVLPNTGWIMSFPKLAVDVGLKRPTLFKYLSFLEGSLLVNSVMNVAGSFRSTSRVLRKLYPASPNFLSVLPEHASIGAYAEAYTAQYLWDKGIAYGLYHSHGHEIDFLIHEQKTAIEVKYQNTIHPGDYRFLASLVKEKGYRGVILTKQTSETLLDGRITCLPLDRLEETGL